MSERNGALGFILGTVAGAAVGTIAGLLLAPRSGAESRAMAADALNDAWDSALDTYEQGTNCIYNQVDNFRPQVDATTDELRAKVDAARERMDQLRGSLSDSVVATTSQVQDAVDTVSSQVKDVISAQDEPCAATDVHIEAVEDASQPAAE